MKTLREPRKAKVGKNTAGLQKHVIYLFLSLPLNFHNGLQANLKTTSFEHWSHISCSYKMKSYQSKKKKSCLQSYGSEALRKGKKSNITPVQKQSL